MNAIIDRVRKTTESSVGAQQELVRKWVRMWPWLPVSAFPFGEVEKLQTKWVEMAGELFERQNHLLAMQLEMGLGTINRLFGLVEAQDTEDLRSRTAELWRKSFDYLWLISAAQMRGLHNALTRLTELAGKESKPEPKGPEAARTPAKDSSDREELREALEEYEMARGDWSKGH